MSMVTNCHWQSEWVSNPPPLAESSSLGTGIDPEIRGPGESLSVNSSGASAVVGARDLYQPQGPYWVGKYLKVRDNFNKFPGDLKRILKLRVVTYLVGLSELEFISIDVVGAREK